MAVNPLGNRPVPQNSNMSRAMYVWITASAPQDPLDIDNDQNALLAFCGTHGVNTLFLDMWVYLGGSNWTNAKRDRMKLFVDAAHRSGIKVYALAGNVDWAVNQQWVLKNIVEPYMAYNSMATSAAHRFDGMMLDVEYWQDEEATPPATHLPGLLDLVKAIKNITHQPVGLFAGFFLKDNDSTRPAIGYNGKTAQDGEHMMDVADFIVVGAYRDTAAAASPLFQPWYDYAAIQGKNFSLYCGSETTNVTPSNITYFGQTKAAMEAEHTAISNTFKVSENAVFLGQAIHSYDGYKVMT